MYEYLHALLSDKKGGEVFTCFGAWHVVYMLIFAAAATLAVLYLKNKSKEDANKFIRRLLCCAFGLYIADFFLMPFAYEEIDIEKLPFHICTAMCVCCFICTYNRFFEGFLPCVSRLAFLSNLVYLIYPAGVMWYSVHPLSYRVIQTLTFHGLMSVYGLLMLLFSEPPRLKVCYRDLPVIGAMTLWALLGNLLYNGTAGSYSHEFNWFFVLRDPFYMLPESIAPFIMPILNTLIFFAADILLYLFRIWIEKIKKEHKNAHIQG